MGLPRQENNIKSPAFCNLRLQSDFALDIPGLNYNPLPRHFMYGNFLGMNTHWRDSCSGTQASPVVSPAPSQVVTCRRFNEEQKNSTMKLLNSEIYKNMVGEFHGMRSKILWSFFLLGSLAVVVVVVMVVTSKLVNY